MKFSLKVVCFFALTLILLNYVGDNDTWFHLRIGQELWESKSFIRTEIFSFSGHGEPWLNHEWPFQLGLYGVHSFGGFAAMAIAVATVGASIFLLLKRREFYFSHAVLFGVVALSLRPFIVPRPQILAYLALAALLFFLDRYIRSRSRKDLFFIPIILLIWGNLHASVILALPILAAYALDFLFGSLKSLSKENKNNFFITCFAGLLLTLANPLGYKVYLQALQPLVYGEVYKTLLETTSLIKHVGTFSGNFIFGVHMALGIMLSLLLLRRRSEGWREYLLGIVFWVVPFMSIKYIPFSWIIILPIVLRILPKLEPGKMFKISVVGLACAAAVLFAWKVGGGARDARAEWPQELVKFIDEQQLKGNVFNPLSWGGYLTWNSPERPVFIWGGCDCFYNEQYFEAVDFGKGERVDELIKKYSFSIALVRPWESLAHSLSIRPDWALIYWDNFGMIFVRRGGENEATIKKYSLDLPYLNDTPEAILRKVPKEKIQFLIQNYEEAIRRKPDLTLGRMYIGSLYQALGKCDLAIPHWQAIIRGGNNLGFAYQKLAECYRATGNTESYKQTIELANKYKNQGKLWLGRP